MRRTVAMTSAEVQSSRFSSQTNCRVVVGAAVVVVGVTLEDAPLSQAESTLWVPNIRRAG
jgi:hypothetical protein